MKILVTGANGDIGEAIGRILIEGFPDAEISGADAAGRWPGGFIFKNMYPIALASEPAFLDDLYSLGKQFDLIIPTSEPELRKLSQIKDIQSQLPLLMVSPKILNTFMDKYETALFFATHDLPAPKTKLFSETKITDLPVYIKPRKGSGGRGHFSIKTPIELESAKLIASADWVAQEYLFGDNNEYTCALSRLNGSVKSLALKRQLKGDKTVKAEVVDVSEIHILLKKIAEVLDLNGCINVQLKLTSSGPKVFEINPRLSSTVMMRHLLGFKDCEWWVKSFLGLPLGEISLPPVGATVHRMSVERIES